MKDKQELQEDEYSFPYHYVSQYNTGFRQTFNDTWGINYVATIEFLLEQLALHEFESAIDIGCGDGRFTQELQENHPNKTIVGVDYSQRAISLAHAMNPKGDYRCVDITKWTPERSFDIAVLMEVFEHIPVECGDDFLYAVSKMLCPAGMLFMTVPHQNKPVEYKHFRHFDAESIVRCLEPYYKIIDIIPFELISYKKKLIDVLLTNNYFILNHQGLKNKLYSYYKTNLFLAADETKCKRLFIKAQRK